MVSCTALNENARFHLLNMALGFSASRFWFFSVHLFFLLCFLLFLEKRYLLSNRLDRERTPEVLITAQFVHPAAPWKLAPVRASRSRRKRRHMSAVARTSASCTTHRPARKAADRPTRFPADCFVRSTASLVAQPEAGHAAAGTNGGNKRRYEDH